MKKWIPAFLLGAVLATPSIKAQQVEEQFCGTTDSWNRWLSESEENAAAYEKNWHRVTEFVKNNPNYKKDGKYVIPVVFHVVHLGGSENLSHAVLENLIEQVNIDMQGENSSADIVKSYMPDLVGVADFELRIATKDPFGNPSDGVERYYSEDTQTEANYGSNSGAGMKTDRQWDVNRYLNIYIVKQIVTGGAGGGGVEGYAQFPGGNANTDGIVLEPRLVTSQTGGTTHEFGHFFGLCHTWACSEDPSQPDNCLFDDNIEDTPNCIGLPSGYPCNNTSTNTCTDDVDDRPDNFQNFMDYSYCFANFTPDQIAVMHGNAETNARRKSLWQSANLTNVGVDYDGTPAAPVADFYPSVYENTICAGASVTYTYDGFDNVDTYSWQFPGGTPSTSSAKNPTVVYNTGGTFNATLTVSNGNGTHSFTMENVVEVFGSAPINLDYVQPFNSGFTLSAASEFIVEDVQGDGRTWVENANVGNKEVGCIWINNRFNTLGNIDRLLTSTLDLTNLGTAALDFDYAFAQKGSVNSDILSIYVSEDCGVTFSKRRTLNGKTTLKTADNTTGNFVPDAEEWKHLNLDLTAYAGKIIQVMLEFEAGGGNNLYIDDFELTGVIGVEEQMVQNLKLVPNPMGENQSELKFTLSNTQQVDIAVYSMFGQKVMQVASGELNAGNHSYMIERNGIATGVYLVNIATENGNTTQKLVVQ